MTKRVCVVGCGYIGLPTATMFAKHGCNVLAVDVNEQIIEKLNQGEIIIEEPGLAEVVQEAVASGNLRGSQTLEEADYYIVTVPTPNSTEDGLLGCDLRYVLAATKSVIGLLKQGDVVIVESTVAPRTLNDYIKPLIEQAGFEVGVDVYLAHCPERVIPGRILHELIYNNRLVGGITPLCTDKAAELYSVFVKGEILKTEAKTAEFAKCMENTYRDVNIALANELAMMCNDLEINCLDVIRLANKHPRVDILKPGPGVGGHCLAVDPYFLYAKDPERAKIIELSRRTNSDMPAMVAQYAENLMMGSGFDTSKELSIVAFGTAYKANVDDCRESPAMEVVDILRSHNHKVHICDPHVNPDAFINLEDIARDADLLLVLVGHDEFKEDKLFPYATLMKEPLVFDVCDVVDNTMEITVVNYGNLYQFLK